MRLRPISSTVAPFLIAVLAVVAVASYAADQGAKDRAATRWEHMALTHDGADLGNNSDLAKRITRVGDEGWELVDVSTVVINGTTEKTIFFFKRPK